MVLTQEEEFWALKSRVNWMIQGDRNTSFYHVSTLVRRKRNQILAIKDLTGEWIHEEMGVGSSSKGVLRECILPRI